MRGTIFDIKELSIHDGPGSRVTVFLKGCPLRCNWCDRPQVRKPKKELLYDVESCVDCMVCFPECSFDAHDFVNGQHIVDRYKCVGCMACCDACPAGALMPASRSMGVDAILSQCQKRLILGGGEPLVQHEGVLELLKKAKEKGIATCIETTGAFYPSQIPAILPYTDIFVFRITDTDPARMKKNTGAKLEVLLSNLKAIDEAGGKTLLRCKLIPGINLENTHAEPLAALYASLKHCQGIAPVGYQPTDPMKWKMLDLAYPPFPAASKEDLDRFIAALQNAGATVIL